MKLLRSGRKTRRKLVRPKEKSKNNWGKVAKRNDEYLNVFITFAKYSY
jgi:hypothetical protein